MNTQHIALITFAIFASTTTHAMEELMRRGLGIFKTLQQAESDAQQGACQEKIYCTMRQKRDAAGNRPCARWLVNAAAQQDLPPVVINACARYLVETLKFESGEIPLKDQHAWWQEQFDACKGYNTVMQSALYTWFYLLDPVAHWCTNPATPAEPYDRFNKKLASYGVSLTPEEIRLVRCSPSELVRYKLGALQTKFGKAQPIQLYESPWATPKDNVAELEYYGALYTLDGLEHLEKVVPSYLWGIHLMGNGLVEIPRNSLSRFTHLNRIIITRNRLTSDCLPAIMALSGLKRLVLSDNEIKELPADFFAKLPKLRILLVGGNLLPSFPTSYAPPPLFDSLDCHGNYLSEDETNKTDRWFSGRSLLETGAHRLCLHPQRKKPECT